MPEIKKEIGEIVAELEEWQARENLTQKGISKLLAVGQPTVSKLLKGQLPYAPSFHKLCTLAGISVHKSVDPWTSPVLTEAVRDAWDGSEDGARAISLLLLAARRISAGAAHEVIQG